MPRKPSKPVSRPSEDEVREAIWKIVDALRFGDDEDENGARLLRAVCDACDDHSGGARVMHVAKDGKRTYVRDIEPAIAYGALVSDLAALRAGDADMSAIIERFEVEFGLDLSEQLPKLRDKHRGKRDGINPKQLAAKVVGGVTGRGENAVKRAWQLFEDAKQVAEDDEAVPDKLSAAHPIYLAFHEKLNSKRFAPPSPYDYLRVLLNATFDSAVERQLAIAQWVRRNVTNSEFTTELQNALRSAGLRVASATQRERSAANE